MINKMEMNRIRQRLESAGEVFETSQDMALFSLVGSKMNYLQIREGTAVFAHETESYDKYREGPTYIVMLASPQNDEERYLCAPNVPAGALKAPSPLKALAAQAE